MWHVILIAALNTKKEKMKKINKFNFGVALLCAGLAIVPACGNDAKHEDSKEQAKAMKLGDYKDDSKDNWQNFKREINHDMDELTNAITDLMTTSKK